MSFSEHEVVPSQSAIVLSVEATELRPILSMLRNR